MSAQKIALSPRTRFPLAYMVVGPADQEPYDVLVIPKTDDASDAQADDLQAMFRVMLGLMRGLPHGKLTLHISDGNVVRILKEESIVIK